MSRNRFLRFVLLASLLSAMGLVGCGHEPSKPPVAPEVVSGVVVVPVERASVPDAWEVPGTVRAARTSLLASQLLANVVAIDVQEGARVRRGEVLAVLDDAQPRAELERATAARAAAQQEAIAAEAEYELAATTFRRYQDLYAKQSVSPQEFDEIQARYRATAARRELARARLEQARAAQAQANTVLGYTRIRAPFDGVVTEKRVDPGTLVTPGMVLLVVEDTQRFRLEVTVDEDDIGFVRQGQTVPVRIDALGNDRWTGRVVQIVPAADPASRSFLVKVELPVHAGLRSGLFGRAWFVRGRRTALLVPATAVVERGQLQAVYTLGPDHVARLRYVTLGSRVDDRIEVLSGLTAGERVVAQPGGRDLAGKRVEASRP